MKQELSQLLSEEDIELSGQDKQLVYYDNMNESIMRDGYRRFTIKLYVEMVEIKRDKQPCNPYIEFFPEFETSSMLLNNRNISLNAIVEKLKRLGLSLDGKLVAYYSFDAQIYINCGTDPLHQEIQIQEKEMQDQKVVSFKKKRFKQLKIRFSDTGQNLIHLIMSEEMNDAVARMREGSDTKTEVASQSQEKQQNICRRTKERRIGFIIDKVVQWREKYNGKKDDSGKMIRKTLDEAAKEVGISKKSLDDYLLQIRYGKKYGFNFNEHKNDKVGVLRAFVKKHNQSNSKQKADKQQRKKKEQIADGNK